MGEAGMVGPSWYGVHGEGGKLSIVGASCGVRGDECTARAER